jgi:endonuclease G
MSLAVNRNGVSSVDAQRGLVQYVTRTAGGSSGSPCFDDDWKVVALHHAERSRPFGSVREGILVSSIARELTDLL